MFCDCSSKIVAPVCAMNKPNCVVVCRNSFNSPPSCPMAASPDFVRLPKCRLLRRLTQPLTTTTSLVDDALTRIRRANTVNLRTNNEPRPTNVLPPRRAPEQTANNETSSRGRGIIYLMERPPRDSTGLKAEGCADRGPLWRRTHRPLGYPAGSCPSGLWVRLRCKTVKTAKDIPWSARCACLRRAPFSRLPRRTLGEGPRRFCTR